MKLDRHLVYFCRAGKNPNYGKVACHCAPKNCPKLGTRQRKKPKLVQITAPESANKSLP